MSYLIKATAEAYGDIRPGASVYWQTGETRWVDDECAAYYQAHTDVFSVLDGPTPQDGLSLESYIAVQLLPGSMAAALIDFNAAGEAGMAITIGGVVYQEADTAAPATGVWTNGASAAASATSLIAAINGDTRATVPFTAVADESGDGVWLFWDAVGTAGNVDITTDSASNCTVQNATGGAAAAIKKQFTVTHTVNAQELLSGAVEIPVPFTPTMVQVHAYSATGAQIYYTDLVTIETEPDRIKINTDGATNLADTNVLHILAVE